MSTDDRIREIQPNTTAAATPDGRWLDWYIAHTSWAMRVLGRVTTAPREAPE